ncbi:hypothetical protein GVAV_001433 [Gurleya vavrai]
MTLKRIRNKKIEPGQKHPILELSKLDTTRIQDHVQMTLNTGMEQQEKEEVHLKTALIDEKSAIPLPEIKECKSIIIYPLFKKLKELIKYNSDVSNYYILSNDDLEFINSKKISIEDFYFNIEKINEENEKYAGNKEIFDSEIDFHLRNYIQDRILHLYDENGHNSYACFRKRIIKTARKSRKQEASCIEKLKRMWCEIYTLKRLYELSVFKYQFELENMKLVKEMTKVGVDISNHANKKIRRKTICKIIGKKKTEKEELFYKRFGTEDILNDGWKINQYKVFLKQFKLSEKQIDEEAKFLMKFGK